MNKQQDNNQEHPVLIILGIILVAGTIVALVHKFRQEKKTPAPIQQVEIKPALTVEHAYLRVREPDIDAGTIHVFVRNTGDKTLSFSDIKLEDRSIFNKVIGTRGQFPYLQLQHPLAVWSTVFPPELKSGKVADVMIRLAENPLKPLEVSIHNNEQEPLLVTINPKSTETLVIESITFAHDLATAYVYVTNKSEKEYSKPVFDWDTTRAPILTRKWEKIRPQETALAKFAFASPLQRGDCVNVKLTTAENVATQASIRAFSLFPISTWPHGGYTGDTREDMGFDPAMFSQPFAAPGGDPKLTTPQPATDNTPDQGIYVYRNTNCRDANFALTLGANANICWDRAWQFYKTDQQRAVFGHVCLYQKIRSCYVYGEVLDFVGFTPFEVSGFPVSGNRRYSGNPLRNSYFARAAVNAAAPRPAILNQFVDYLPEELEISVWSQIGEGVKGVLYSHSRSVQKDTPRGDALTGINTLLQNYKSYLSISAPVKAVRQQPENAHIYTLQCGDQGMFVITVNERFSNRFATSNGWIRQKGELMNDSIRSFDPITMIEDIDLVAKSEDELMEKPRQIGKDRAFRAEPLAGVNATIILPDYLNVRQITHIYGDKVSASWNQDECRLNWKILTTLSIILIK